MKTRWLIFAACLLSSAHAQDATDILRKSVTRDAYNFERMKNYTFLERTEERRYSKDGKLNSKEVETYEIMILAGRPYGRLVERDDKPLSEKETRKEQQEMDKELAKRERESEKDKANRDKDRVEERRFLREVPDAFILTLLGSETIDNRPVWVIRAEPKPGYKPQAKRADLLTKLRGKIWVDQSDYQWVKADVEVINSISYGLGLLKLAPGATMHFEQTRVNDEVWLPLLINVRASARLIYFKNIHAEVDVTYRDYKKFQADSQIIGVEETR